MSETKPAPGVRADQTPDQIQSRSADPGQSSYGGFCGEDPRYQHQTGGDTTDRSQRATRVRSDASLHDLLCERLWRSGIDVSEVSLTVREGEVTLEGAIGTRADRARIEDAIDRIPGVRAVENRVRVAPDRSSAGS